MLASSALISNSRALTNAPTSRSPFWLRALSEDWARMDLAKKVLTRLLVAARMDSEGLLVVEVVWGCFRFLDVLGDI